MTNYERIKAMTIEEMAEWFYNDIDKCAFCVYNNEDYCGGCKNGHMCWLESEVEA